MYIRVHRCIHIHTYAYICIYIYIHTYISVYIYICVCILVYVYAHTSVYIIYTHTDVIPVRGPHTGIANREQPIGHLYSLLAYMYNTDIEQY